MKTSEDRPFKLSSFQLHEKAVQAPVGDRLAAFDAIELSGEILVVLTWLAHTEQGLRKPEFVLPLAAVKHQDLSADPAAPCKWSINVPLSPSLFDGTASRQVRRQLSVRRGPELTLPLRPVRH
ncbi:hypothetical protein GOC57_11650 [Sinorhizobium meliloti]|nr:hypothetical protein [Sinorhizobium meliloti]MDW9859451.1 hypothetical protein [Sinorhizobium meliloti]MDW9964572.1 hypothetical protein [Sinorhizobium meliloti]MDX0336830.1 hypothetical protein [Sinorhizobium meliloti]